MEKYLMGIDAGNTSSKVVIFDLYGKMIATAATPSMHFKRRGEGYLRLFDLGFFRDSRVLPLYECAGGGTRVYRVKDTLIALRDADAARIFVEEGM